MKLPVLKKQFAEQSAFIERKLPTSGEVLVKVGDTVNSFDKLGTCSVIRDSEKLEYSGKLVCKEGDRVYPGDVLAERKKLMVKKHQVKCTISGTIAEINKKEGYILVNGVGSNYTLISGVSGEVVDILNNQSILIKTSAVVIKGIAGSGNEVAGELVYIKEGDLTDETITDQVNGKIIVANSATSGAIAKAKTIGALGFILASCEYSDYRRFVKDEISVLVLEGFGGLAFNKPLLKYFKDMDSKFGAVRTFEGMLIIPGEDIAKIVKNPSANMFESEPNIGDSVQIFSKEYFGKSGSVKEIKDNKLILTVDDNVVEVDPNLVGLLV
jgi:hypothetical protein